MPRPSAVDADLAREIGERIRAARSARNVSQEGLAELLSVSAETVSRYETAAIPVSIAQLFNVASALEVGVEALLGLHVGDDEDGPEAELIDLFRLLSDDDQDLVLGLVRRLGG